MLILDQFEEFFTFHTPERRKTFIAQLADLVNGIIPAELRKSMEPGKPFPYSENPPNVKILISIREDFLGQLDELSEDIPDILHNRFRLSALTRDQAREAITKPSQLKDDHIRTTGFGYAAETVEMMLDFLCKRKEKDGIVIKDEVESFQLQLLCHHIENKVRLEADKGDGDIIVKKQDLGGEPGMRKVLQNFYDDHIKQLGARKKKSHVRKLCEKGLISVTDRRLSLEEENIELRFKVSPSLLGELVDGRLLRSDKRVGSVYYELSHDALVAPIRESQRRQRIRNSKIAGLILIPVLIVTAIVYQYQMNVLKRENEISRLYSQAGDFKSRGKNKEAEEKYNDILKIDQKNIKVYRELGQLFIKSRKFGEAIPNRNSICCSRAQTISLFT